MKYIGPLEQDSPNSQASGIPELFFGANELDEHRREESGNAQALEELMEEKDENLNDYQELWRTLG